MNLTDLIGLLVIIGGYGVLFYVVILRLSRKH